MSDRTHVTLTPVLIELDSPEFEAICGWEFPESYVGRLLQNDIPRRVRFNRGRVWVYTDPGGQLVGFGTFDVCDEYLQYTAGQVHPYIPLLAVNRPFEGLGYGKSIVRHLIGEAALSCRSSNCHDVLFLDVYTANKKAIGLYERCEFTIITDEPIPDPDEDGKPYIIMTRRVSTSGVAAPS